MKEIIKAARNEIVKNLKYTGALGAGVALVEFLTRPGHAEENILFASACAAAHITVCGIDGAIRKRVVGTPGPR